MTKSIMAGIASVIALVCFAQLGACSDESPPSPAVKAPPATAAPPPPPSPPPAQPPTAPVAQAPTASLSAESLEALLAPIALYPDPVLAQVLATSANPQEVLDAGNWLIQNPDLTGSALESAAIEVGFTPPMVALAQFPTVVDMMCMEMDWTTELGAAFVADQPGVLDAVQRLRKQAAELGNLESSEQMKVTTESVNDQNVIIVQPAQPEVIYVPQYNPDTVYTTPAPAATTTQVVTTDADDGYSGGEMITAGLLAFGAGILVNEVFDDDDDDYYHPNWGGGYGGYYPPPYQPRYGNGYRPAHTYQRPANYQRGSNNNIYVNADGDNYFNRFDSGRNNYRKKPNSPITNARKDRPELGALNDRKPTLAGANKTLQGSYAGRKPEVREAAGLAKRPTAALKAPTGSYAGAKLAQKDRPQVGGARDRGRLESANAKRPASGGKLSSAVQNRPQVAKHQPQRPGGFQGAHDSGKFERAASKRGRDSMAERPRPSKARSGGGKRR